LAHIISGVALNSPAHRAGVTVGDELTAIDGEPVIDLFDYQLKTASSRPVLHLVREGEAFDVRVRKSSEDPMGLTFADNLLGSVRKCANFCLFCFADQLPAGLRPSLYVKDDDWRHSVLFGNYVTLTNLSEAEFTRVLELGVSPLYISVHSTNPMLRARLLRRKNDRLASQLARMVERGMAFHGQVVLCPGLNDGQELVKTIVDLSAMYPNARSLAVVPVGLSAHREGLPNLTPVDRNSARDALDIIERAQHMCLAKLGTRFVFGADELYLAAGRPLPVEEAYEDFEQIGNGVGMLTWLESQLFEAAVNLPAETPLLSLGAPRRSIAIATGLAAAPFLQTWLSLLPLPGIDVTVVAVTNHFFGPGITVAGLLTGGDVARAIREQHIRADEVFIPNVMLRQGEDIFLDDTTPQELAEAIGMAVRVVGCDGEALWRAIIGIQEA